MNKELKTNELDDKEIEQVNGGAKAGQYIDFFCSECGQVFKVDVNKSSAICPKCKRRYTLAG